MKKTTIITILLCLSFALGLKAQGYHLGQVITNPDGSQGVVFYLNEDGSSGWMVALHDVALAVPWGLTDEIEGLDHVIISNNDYLTTAFADTDGYSNTLAIRNHYQSTGYTGQYAAGMIDIANGWYLPAAGQLKMLYVNAIFYESALESVGEKLGLHPYWSSTQENTENAWYVHFGSPYPEEAWSWNAYLKVRPKTNNESNYGGYFAVRPIRDLEFSPLPIIGHLYEPAVICDEGPIELVMPNLVNADSYGWEIADNVAFTNPIAYVGQNLDLTYDGWYLRLWATNEEGTSYSNAALISVHETNSGYATASSCEPYEWNGQIYDESGIYQATLLNQWGCDSIATLDLTIHQPDVYFVPYPVYACESYEWNDMTLTESGAYEQTFTNQYGCDSIVTMSLYIKHNVEHQFTHVGCGEYDWNGQLCTVSGDYQQTFPAANGCDSIVTLHLDLIDDYYITLDTAVCENFVWNGHEYTQSGQFEQSFVTSIGCDSVVSMNLVVWQHPEPIPEIVGLQEIFVSTDFVQYGYNYYIDPVASATHYEWVCEDSAWIVNALETHCTLLATSPVTATLKVRAWNNYCGYTEQEILIHAGFFDLDENQTLPVAVYPNPAHDKVFIESENILKVRLLNLQGQVLKELSGSQESKVELPLTDYVSGIYFVEIVTERGMVRTKLNVFR